MLKKRITVLVQPSSKKEEVKPGDIWIIRVKEPPISNRANVRVIEILKKYFRSVKLIRGFKNKRKIFEVEDD